MSYFEYKNKLYPSLIKEGFHSQYCLPIAKKVLHGVGVDIGFSKYHWKFPGAIGIDSVLEAPYNDALNLPFDDESLDYVFSSHCLEHIPKYIDALEEWKRVLKKDGVLFLYLPDSSKMEYWKPSNNRKHFHEFKPKQIKKYLEELNFKPVFASETDLAYSFIVYGYKK